MDKQKIARQVRALRQRTVENGCTEAEAAAAITMIASLLDKYNLSVEECDLRENAFAKDRREEDSLIGERLWKPADGIAHLLDIRYWAEAPGMPAAVTFFGFDHEVEIAHYLLDICRSAMGTGAEEIERKTRLLRPAAARRRLVPFLDGMADRLRERLREMKPIQPPGKGLVVLRGQLIEAELKREGTTLNSGRPNASRDFEPAYNDGVNAADRVSFAEGVRGPTNIAGRIEG